jgi:hypothetical protein
VQRNKAFESFSTYWKFRIAVQSSLNLPSKQDFMLSKISFDFEPYFGPPSFGSEANGLGITAALGNEPLQKPEQDCLQVLLDSCVMVNCGRKRKRNLSSWTVSRSVPCVTPLVATSPVFKSRPTTPFIHIASTSNLDLFYKKLLIDTSKQLALIYDFTEKRS